LASPGVNATIRDDDHPMGKRLMLITIKYCVV